ncbi:MAG TPA: TMEM165/GDT1 family protein [Rhizomicrobium sp.]|jgi:putative Ca2+/H+ antiporter (TMEM165/GDT1 family)|nr:TMEM165/GDT1 family protein [Rhizomicrobium sp.]
MQAFLVSVSTVAVAEMGDRTQLLSMLLAARFRKPWPIIAGILLATIANHALAALIGVEFAKYLTPFLLNSIVGVSLIGMSIWTMIPDKIDENEKLEGRSAFTATLIAFFIAEMGDKTQIATAALAAGYHDLFAVVAGSTSGMMVANMPAVFLGHNFAASLPMRAIHIGGAILFAALGVWFIAQAFL